MRVVVYGPYAPNNAYDGSGVDRREFGALLVEADVVSLHVPLTPDTKGLLDADAIACMKPGAVLINATRGGVVDEPALAATWRLGHLGGGALDVFADVPNLVLTSHIAGVTEKSNTRVSWVTVENVRKALAA